MKKYSARIVIPKATKIEYLKILGEKSEHKKSGIAMKETDSELILEIDTSDISLMRSALNSLMRDIQVIEKASSATEKV